MSSLISPIFKTKSKVARCFFIISIVLAGPVSFLLYDYYINWTQGSNTSIVWYLAFLYDTLGAWGGVFLSGSAAILTYIVGMRFHARYNMYAFNR